MRKSRKNASLAAALGLMLFPWAVMFGVDKADAASSPTLPAGWTMYASDCSDQEGQIYRIDTVSGVATPIGESGLNPGSYCPTQGHVNQETGTIYLPQGVGSTTATVDVSSGVITALAGNTDRIRGGIAGDQSGNMLTYNVGSADGTTFEIILSSINPVTGNLSEVARGIVPPDFPSTAFSVESFAFNPADQKFYTILLRNGVNDEFVTIDPSSAQVTRTGIFIDESETGTNHDTNPYSMVIDSNGVAWIADDLYPNDPPDALEQIITVEIATGASRIAISEITNEALYPDGGFYSQSFWLVPGEAGSGGTSGESAQVGASPESAQVGTLAATGGNVDLLALLAALAVTLGLSAVAFVRRSNRDYFKLD